MVDKPTLNKLVGLRLPFRKKRTNKLDGESHGSNNKKETNFFLVFSRDFLATNIACLVLKSDTVLVA